MSQLLMTTKASADHSAGYCVRRCFSLVVASAPGSRLVEDCTNDASRLGRLRVLILRLLLGPIRSGRRRTLGSCLSGQPTALGRPPSLRTRPRTANKQD